jgi:hypothetical protein
MSHAGSNLKLIYSIDRQVLLDFEEVYGLLVVLVLSFGDRRTGWQSEPKSVARAAAGQN